MIGHYPIKRKTEVLPLTLSNPIGIDYDAGTNRFAVVNFSGSVLILDGSSFSVLATVTGITAVAVARFDPTLNRIFTGGEDGGISIIDGVTYAVTSTSISGINTPRDIAFDVSTNRLIVSSYGSSLVRFYDLTTFAAVHSMSVTGPVGLWNDATNRKLYIARHSNNVVQVFNIDTYTSIATITPTGDLAFQTAYGVCKDPSLNRLLVTNNAGNKVSVIDLSTDTVVGQLIGITTPRYLVFKSDIIYVTAANVNRVVYLNRFYS